MACKVKRELKLSIYDDEEGYESWNIGHNIQLILNGKILRFGTIEEIFAEYLMLNNEYGMSEMIKFSEIEGYHSLIDKSKIF